MVVKQTTGGMKGWQESHQVSWRCRSDRCREDQEGKLLREYWWGPASC